MRKDQEEGGVERLELDASEDTHADPESCQGGELPLDSTLVFPVGTYPVVYISLDT